MTSDAFRADGVIPARFTCDGDDVSPPLTWEGLPDGAESLVLIVDDPDAPGGGFTHWLLYNLDAAAGGLPEGVGKDDPALDGGLQGLNDFGDTGYGGPCPPEGEAHRYNFRLYVIDGTIDLGPGASADEVLAAIEGRMLALTTLTGTYERQ